jgi:hypothetical protein
LLREKVAVATVEGKAYFLIVNWLREQDIPFTSLVPGEPVPAGVKAVITTPHEKQKVEHEKILVFTDEDELEYLTVELKRILQGKEAYQNIVVGIDPGEATGVAVIADGKVIEEDNCFSIPEVVHSIKKNITKVNFSLTAVYVKVGNGVPVYKDILEALDEELPSQVILEVVGEAGTNKPLNKHGRGVRHISSAKRIAGRAGHSVPRRKSIAANSRTQ